MQKNNTFFELYKVFYLHRGAVKRQENRFCQHRDCMSNSMVFINNKEFQQDISHKKQFVLKPLYFNNGLHIMHMVKDKQLWRLTYLPEHISQINGNHIMKFGEYDLNLNNRSWYI